MHLNDLGEGNSGPGGRLRPEHPLITSLYDLDVRLATLRHKTTIETRVEIAPKTGGDPILSLLPSEAGALGFMLRRRAAQAPDDGDQAS